MLKVPSDAQPTSKQTSVTLRSPPTQQRHRALDAPRHQIAVRRFAEGEPEQAPAACRTDHLGAAPIPRGAFRVALVVLGVVAVCVFGPGRGVAGAGGKHVEVGHHCGAVVFQDMAVVHQVHDEFC
jgi:hypothetical protein